MENEKKEGKKEEIPLEQYLDKTRKHHYDIILFGSVEIPGEPHNFDSVKYKCSNCTNTFMADEICWNDGEDGKQIPFCPNCSNNCKNYDKAYVLDKV